jgi:hypothetical protein
MILFFDRSIGITVPQLLQTKSLKFPFQVHYHQQHFDMNEQDDVWLNQIGQWGWTVVGHDSKYHKKPSELSAIKQYKIGCFYLWGSEAVRWEKLRCFARAYDRIIQAEVNTPKPFIYRVTRLGALHAIKIP